LYWTSTNATSCSSSPENWTNGSAPYGNSVLWPTVTTTYWVNCYGVTVTVTWSVAGGVPVAP
jgi:hypothetical protein